MKYLIGVLVALGCACEEPRSQQQKNRDELLIKEEKASSENCLNSGGVVVRSAWDGRIKDCKPAPSKGGGEEAK